ncbi:hypothetical protein BASA81_015585 [Batrachochytrium salamandrivorans]|nr:hypothetical protein BASA81_015585 [Batrachochytrium salamandrivorans]
MPQNMRQRLVQNDLDAFDRLRVRDVSAGFGDAASNFLAEFQSTAASLEPDERIKLVVSRHEGGVELLKAVLADPQANKICSLFWWYEGKEDVNLVLPLLINHCPGLASLEVDFKHHSAFDFVSSVLERPNNKVKVLEMTGHPEGDFTRFFVALGQSQVSALALSHFPKFAQGLHEYLARDLLVRLDVQMNYVQVSSEMMMLLAECTRLTKLKMLRCVFSQPTAFTFPKSITKLELCHCLFVGGFDWSFLASSNVRELDLRSMAGVDGNRLGSALAVQLRAKGLDTLRLDCRDFVNKTLATAGVELGRIKRLEIYSDLNDASIKLIALALQSPDSEMRELVFALRGQHGKQYHGPFGVGVEAPQLQLGQAEALDLWTRARRSS